MPDIFLPCKRSEIMRKIRSKNTGPELKIRKLLHEIGYRFRLHVKSLPGTPDIVLSRYSTVIQVRGCFWHYHGCKYSKIPKTNTKYWLPKIINNRKRDVKNDKRLRSLGWSVIVVWECKCRNKDNTEREISRIHSILLRKNK